MRRLPLLLVAAALVACEGLTPADGTLDFGEVFLPGVYEGRYVLENPDPGAVTLSAPSWEDGRSFALVTAMPQEIDGGVPWGLDFTFTATEGAVGEHTDTVTFAASGGGSDYTVTVTLRAVFTDGDVDRDGHIDEQYGGDDCDDTQPTVYAGAQELCDGLDNDCDGTIGDAEADGDRDDVRVCAGDCADDDPLVFPGAPEGCDGIDTDCDGSLGADELDGDNDGWTGCEGDCEPDQQFVHPGMAEIACDGFDTDCSDGGEVPPLETDDDRDDYRPCSGDCDDDNHDAHPGQPEACDGFDTDCDNITPANESDHDGDLRFPCNGDCDDSEPTVYTGAPEVCDGLDSNCDGVLPAAEEDADSDGDPNCSDCAPEEPAAHSGATEVCDEVDNNCDGSVDEGFDADQDGFFTCTGDCDDGDPAVNPTGTEVCDGPDNDCDGVFTLGEEFDSDGDGSLDCADADCPLYVDQAYSGGSSDGSPAAPFTTLAAGIAAVEAGSCVTLWVQPGTYTELVDYGSSELRLIAEQGPTQTTIDGDLDGPVVTIDGGQSSDALLQGFTITGGRVTPASPTASFGAGIHIDGASPTIQGNVVVDNHALGPGISVGYGGGLYSVDGDADILDNVFEQNTAAYVGGGVFLDNHGGEFSGNTVDDNAAFHGGGVVFDNGSSSDAFMNTFEENAASDWAGAVGIWSSDQVEFTNNLVNANTSGEGGGMYVFSCGPTVVNNTFVDNHATDVAEVGGVRIWNGTYRNNIIASGTGYGVAIQSNSLVGLFQYNDVFDYSLGPYMGTDLTGTGGNLALDPLFTDFTADGEANDLLTLQAGSPCIDAGNPAGIFDDADGSPNDLGAYGGPGGAW